MCVESVYDIVANLQKSLKASNEVVRSIIGSFG